MQIPNNTFSDSENISITSRFSSRLLADIFVRGAEWTGYLLFFAMLFVPTRYQLFKGGLLVIVCGAILLDILIRRRILLAKPTIIWTFYYVAIGIIFILIGFVNHAPGAMAVSTVFLIWPLVYLLLCAGASREHRMVNLHRVLVWSVIIITAYSLLFVLTSMGILPRALYIEIDQDQRLTVYQGVVALYSLAAGMLFFAVPYLIASIFLRSSYSHKIFSRKTLWLALLCGVVMVILRRSNGLILVTALAPLMTLIVQVLVDWGDADRLVRRSLLFLISGIAFGVVIALVVVSVGVIYEIDFGIIVSEFRDAFDFVGGTEGMIRGEQFIGLIRGWLERPIFGAGLGNGSPYYVRDFEAPWAYELSYISLLFQTGIVGFTLFSIGTIWIVVMSIRIARRNTVVGSLMGPTLIGFIAFLIGNGTNPYLGKYDNMWVLFLPVAMINLHLLTAHRTRQTATEFAELPYIDSLAGSTVDSGASSIADPVESALPPRSEAL